MNPRGLRRRFSFEQLAIAIAFVSVAAFVIWFATQIREIVVNPYTNSDLASSLLLAEFFGDKGSGALVLGNYPWLEGLLPLHWTRWVPDHVAFWKAAPYVIYAATVLLVGWTVKRLSNWATGLAVVLAMAAPAPVVIYMLSVSDQRLPLFAHTVLLAALLVVLPEVALGRRRLRVLWAVGLAVTLAPAVATDELIYPAAVIPFLAAVALAWWRKLLRLEAAGLAAAACVAGVLGGRLLWAIAEGQEFAYPHGVFQMAGSGRVLSNAALLLEDIALFAQGHFANGEIPVDDFNVARELVAIGTIGAVLFFAAYVVRKARPIFSDDRRAVEQRLLFAFWGISIVGVSLAFVITTAPYGTNAVRYIPTVWPALLTLVVIVVGRRATAGIAVLATVCAVLGCIALDRGLYSPVPGNIDEREAQLVERFAAENHLDHGYAGYWDAAPITVLSDFKARVYPVEFCGPNVNTYCPFYLHQIEAWYQPKQGVGSFFVVNGMPLAPATERPPASWGRPFKSAQLGDLTVYAFDYDISSNFQKLEPGAKPPDPPVQ